MTTEQFAEWVKDHCKYTGANADTAALLVANRNVICGRWSATYAEMCECSQRLIESGRSPKFANEQMNALHSELVRLRGERYAAVKSERRESSYVAGCDCPACNGGEILPAYARAMERYQAQIRELAQQMTPPTRRGK